MEDLLNPHWTSDRYAFAYLLAVLTATKVRQFTLTRVPAFDRPIILRKVRHG